QGAESRYLQRLPSLLHGQIEVRRYGWPHREVQEQVCRCRLCQPEAWQEVAPAFCLPRLAREAKFCRSAATYPLFAFHVRISPRQPFRVAVLTFTMRDLLEQKLARYEQLEKDLVNPEVLSNPARITSVAREHGSLGKLAKKYRKFKQINGQIAEAQQMIEGS